MPLCDLISSYPRLSISALSGIPHVKDCLFFFFYTLCLRTKKDIYSIKQLGSFKSTLLPFAPLKGFLTLLSLPALPAERFLFSLHLDDIYHIYQYELAELLHIQYCTVM